MVQVLPGARIESIGRMLWHLIGWAYEINTSPQRAVGDQEILETEFNIVAKAAAESLTVQEARAMLRTLLEDRFQLRWRLQPREVDGYLMMPSRDDGLSRRAACGRLPATARPARATQLCGLTTLSTNDSDGAGGPGSTADIALSGCRCRPWDRSSKTDRGAQKIASGLSGEPIPFSIRSGAAMNRNS